MTAVFILRTSQKIKHSSITETASTATIKKYAML